MTTVKLLPYSHSWPDLFAVLQVELQEIFEPERVAIEHIGSTAVPELCAKPVIDILLGAQSLSAIEQKIPALGAAGFQYVSRYEVELPLRRYFVRSAPNALCACICTPSSSTV